MSLISSIGKAVSSLLKPVNVVADLVGGIFDTVGSWFFGKETLSKSFIEKSNEIINKLPLNGLNNSLFEEEKKVSGENEETFKIDFYSSD